MKRLIGPAALAAALVLPITAQANTVNPQLPSEHNAMQGTIASVDGKYGVTVRELDGALERVTLHRGTVIDPTGLRLSPGMLVTVTGQPDGAAFVANVIDAPVEAAKNPFRSTAGARTAPVPAFAPNGTFQTAGPSAEGGG